MKYNEILTAYLNRSDENGNPTWYACWVDEGDNRTIAEIAGSCHQGKFEVRVITFFDEIAASHLRFATPRGKLFDIINELQSYRAISC